MLCLLLAVFLMLLRAVVKVFPMSFCVSLFLTQRITQTTKIMKYE